MASDSVPFTIASSQPPHGKHLHFVFCVKPVHCSITKLTKRQNQDISWNQKNAKSRISSIQTDWHTKRFAGIRKLLCLRKNISGGLNTSLLFDLFQICRNRIYFYFGGRVCCVTIYFSILSSCCYCLRLPPIEIMKRLY